MTDDTQDAVTLFERRRADMLRERRLRTAAGTVLFLAAVVASAYVGEVRLGTFLEGLPGIVNYVHDTLPTLRMGHLWEDLSEWYWALPRWLGLLWDTLLIAFLGTVLGAVGAFVLCFAASANLMRNGAVYFVTRRILEIARAVPELVYAMIFVFSFGLGPLPGVLAIAIHTMGALGKLYSEVNENIDANAIEGVRASGGNWFQEIRYAVVPQVLPNYASYTLLRFEINVRQASVIGFVGAGGIGQELMFVIRQFLYVEVSALVLMIVATVAAIDIGTEKLRHRLIGKEAML